MKLHQFIKEETINFDQLSKYDEKIVEKMKNFEKFLNSHGFKFTEQIPSSDLETELIFNSKLFEIDFKIDFNHLQHYPSVQIGIHCQLSINDEMAAGGGKTFATRIETFAWRNLDIDEFIDTIDTIERQLDGKIKAITDWYFDLSAEYGQVKMLVSDTGQRRIRAIAGDFLINDEKGDVY